MLDSKIVKAASYFAAKKDIRTYLRGVWIESRDGMKAHVLATDGNRMFAHTLPMVVSRPFSVRMSGSTLASVIEAGLFELGSDFKSVVLHNGAVLPLDADPGTYPDWRRVVPRDPTKEPMSLPLGQMADIEKAFKALKVKPERYRIAFNGGNAAVVTHQDLPDLLILQTPFKAMKEVPNDYLAIL